MQITVSSDIKKAQKQIALIHRKHIPRATVNALNWAAFDAIAENKKFMRHVFDRPTRFIINSLKFYKAKIKDQRVVIYHEPKAQVALVHHVEGGQRRQRRSEKRLSMWTVMGKNTKKNKFGNITGARYSKILADLQVFGYSDATQNTKLKSQKYASGKTGKGVKYFMKRGRSGKKIIYEKLGGKRNPRIVPALVETGAAPTYRKRYPFYKLIRRHFTKRIGGIFKRAMDKEIRRAR